MPLGFHYAGPIGKLYEPSLMCCHRQCGTFSRICDCHILVNGQTFDHMNSAWSSSMAIAQFHVHQYIQLVL